MNQNAKQGLHGTIHEEAKVEEENTTKLECHSLMAKNESLFGERMVYIEKTKQPYINTGPCMIQPYVHSTNCNLLLYCTDDSELKTMRATHDKYPYKTNFGDLPELPVRH